MPYFFKTFWGVWHYILNITTSFFVPNDQCKAEKLSWRGYQWNQYQNIPVSDFSFFNFGFLLTCSGVLHICGDTLMLGQNFDDEVWTFIWNLRSVRTNSQCDSTKYWSMIHTVHHRKVPEGKRHCGFAGDHGYDNKINSMQVLLIIYINKSPGWPLTSSNIYYTSI